MNYRALKTSLHSSLLTIFLSGCTHTNSLLSDPPANLPSNCSLAKSPLLNQSLKDTSAKKIFLAYNQSSTSLLLDHDTKRPLSAGWISRIDSHHWSALFLQTKNFKITCASLHEPYRDTLSCMKHIKIYECKQIKKLPSSFSGNFWLAENKLWKDLITDLEKRKVELN